MEDSYDDEKMNEYVDILNIFLIYFKNLFKKQPNLHMFSEIDYNKANSTNRHMELYYTEMLKYKENINDEERTSIYSLEDIDINKCRELYVLNYDDKEYGCQFLFPLLSLLAQLNWRDINWSIIPVKADYDIDDLNVQQK